MERKAFKESAKNEIDKIFTKIEELEAKKDHAKSETKEKYNKRIAELKIKKEELQSKYNKLADTTEDNWEEAKKSFSDSLDNLKHGFKELFSLFSK